MVGDLAQFMVQNDLDDKKLVEKAGSLNLPGRSVLAVTNVLLHLCCQDKLVTTLLCILLWPCDSLYHMSRSA